MKLLVSILATPWIVMLRGFALVLLWRWFLVPLGLPPLGLANALGIALLVDYLTTKPRLSELEKDHWWVHLVGGVLAALITLGLGWIYRGFMP